MLLQISVYTAAIHTKVKILEDGIEFVEGEHTAKLHVDKMTQ